MCLGIPGRIVEIVDGAIGAMEKKFGYA